MHESAGKRRPIGSRKANKWLASMLVEAASSAPRTKHTYLAAQYARIASRRGKKRGGRRLALDARLRVLHAPARRVLPRGRQRWFDQRHADAHTRRLVAQLKRLGHTVVLDPGDPLA